MQVSQALNPRRIARSLVTVLALTFVETIAAPIVAPHISTPASHAVTDTITAAGSTTRSFITIPAGVESITVTVTGGGGGLGGNDVNSGGKGGMAQRVVATFAVTPGDVVSLFPGNAGSNGTSSATINTGGTGVGGIAAGGASTVTDSYWNVNGTSYQNPSFSGGSSGKVGGLGSSGSGGGGGAASVVAINRNIVVIAGGAGGGGGAGSATGAGGTDGVDANTPNSNLMYGGAGKDSGAGLNCSASDGGSGGGGGGGYYAGTGGYTELVGNECSGRGGYRGNAYTYAAISATTSSFNTSSNPSSPLNGTITYTYDVKSPSTCTPSTTIVDIYTVLKFDASVNCTWTVPSTVSVIDIFAVGGGGGGGHDGGTGGGGGAGLSRTAIPVTPSSNVTIRVGYGGRGGLFNAWESDFGETSSVTTSSGAVFNAPGGGAGGNRASGKGAGGSATVNGTFAGGAGGTYPSSGAVGGAGNFGISNYFFGSLNTYAGGGGGGCYFNTYSDVAGAIGRNGGGAGCANTSGGGQVDATNGTAGTGGGGGAGGAGSAGRVIGGKGGSGVILIRYATNAADSFPASVASALSARWVGTDFQYLDSSRRGWIDSSGSNSSTRVLSGSTVQIVDAPATNGNSKTFKTLQGATTDEITLADLPTNYTLFNVARYNNGSKGRLFTSSSGNWLSGFYQGATGSAHHNWWMTPSTGVVQNPDNWLLSTDQLKTYRANGRDVTYNREDVVYGQYWYSSVSTSTGFGINNYPTYEKTDWQVADVIVFNRQLTNGETRAMERYLARIYGLTLDPISQSGETDTALSLDGNQYFQTQYGFGNTINDTFTIEAWVNPTSACGVGGGVRCTIFSKEYAVRATIYDGKFGFIMYGTSTVWEWNDTTLKIPINEWHHIALVKRGAANSNGAVEVYLDGELVYTKAGSPYVLSTANATFDAANILRQNDDQWIYVGAALGTYDRFRGQLDEVKLWKVARTTSEIKQDMHSADASSPSLQLYYDFNKSVGSKTENISNLGYGGGSRADLFTVGTSNYVDVKTTATTTPYTTITFPRTYINQNGGWKVPSGISLVQTAVIGGGGGGGGGYEGGGGGAGGFIETLTTLSAGTIYPVKVGVGGRGSLNPLTPTNGDTTTAFNLTAVGGGAGAVEYNVSNTNVQYGPGSGGSGGGGSWSLNFNGGSGTSGQGFSGGSSSRLEAANSACATNQYAGAGGGGAGGSGFAPSCTNGGNGGAGRASTVLGTTVAGGGGGSSRNAAGVGYGGNNVAGSGGNSATTSNAAVGATGGAQNGVSNTGGGGGAGLSSNGDQGFGGAGGSGVVALRYITALVPPYTKPSNAYLNVGMTETFTTNVAVDSATVGLTRTFKWESTTPTSNGAYTTLKVGTGAANAAYGWVPSDTSTSGSGYLYRLTVTDSDTAGLFITDSSTAYAVINPALVMTGTNVIKKQINVARNETFTISSGTPNYRYTLFPTIRGVTLDTSTVGTTILKISDTASVGTYLETLTVTDSVSASVSIPITLTISAPPSLVNSSGIIENDLVFNIDMANTASYSRTSGTISDISGTKKPVTINGGATFSDDYSGILKLSSSQYLSATGFGMLPSFTIEAYINLRSISTDQVCVFGSEQSPTNVSYFLCIDTGLTVFTGFFNGSWTYKRSTQTLTLGNWTHLVGTFDSTTVGTKTELYINGSAATLKDSSEGAGLIPPTPSNDRVIINKWYYTSTNPSSAMDIGFVRLYSAPFTQAKVTQNYNATKDRFSSINLNQIKPVKKYGVLNLESFTATSGGETKTVSFTNGNRTGIQWDTTTVANQVNLSVQESLSAGTYYDTVTVTDNFGQSTYLPIKFTVTQADTLTVYVDTPTALNYTGSQAILTPTLKLAGALGLEVGATISGTINYKPGGGTCASGGYCRVGDIGPAGGIIFIDTSTAGSDGRIYEAAPYNWTGSDDLASISTYCSNNSSSIGTATAIGQGETNTTNAKNSCLGGAVAKVNTFNASNATGYSNWFIPSSSEAAAMVAYADQMGLIRAGSNWSTGTLGYWTSSESTTTLNRILSRSGSTFVASTALKSEASGLMVRPVRAFRACWAIDTCTAQAVTTIPTNAGLYSIVPSAASLSTGSLSNYVAVNYQPTPLTINKVAPRPINIPWINTKYPDTFTVTISLYAGNGALKYSAVNGTANGCGMDYKKIYTTSQGTCTITVTRYADRNFLGDTTTATILFLAFVNSQPTGQVGSGTTIALNGQTSLTIDDSSTVRVPRITGFTLSGSTLTINGEGFGSAPVTITFERYVNASPSPTPTSLGTVITVAVPAGAVSGPVLVITAGGRDSIDWVDLP